MKSILRFILLALGACLITVRGFSAPIETYPGSGVEIEVEPLYQDLPLRGFSPIRVTIANDSGRERTWSFEFTSLDGFGQQNTLSHEAVLTVADGDTKRFDLMIPLVASADYPRLTLYADGYGTIADRRTRTFSTSRSSYSSGFSSRLVAMSASLSNSNWGELTNASGSSSSRSPNWVLGGAFTPSLMPADWRAYAGFDAVWLTDREWIDTGAAERLAVLDWVATGGQLYICRETGDDSPLPDIPTLNEGPVRRGFGTIHRWTHIDHDLDIEATQDEFAQRVSSTASALESDYDRYRWPLYDELPDVEIRKGLFIGFLVLFAIVVGPANLFFFAREPRRYRLFWTTPALSVGASIAIMLLILFQDGVGGNGHQIAVWHHLPEENKAAFLQEQVSRTALLLDRDFSLETPVSLSPILFASSAPQTGSEAFANHGNYGGDWFRNRSIQGHFIEGVTATRWRLEAASPVTPGSAPELVSTFPFTLGSVYYRDADGHLWHTADLQSGQPVRLEPVSASDFNNTWSAFLENAGAVIKKRLQPLGDRTEYFFAFTEDDSESTIETLDAIDWETQSTLHTGPLARSNP